jgi:hypothetical protein
MNIYYEPQMQSIAERVNNKAKLVQCIQMHNEQEFAPLVLKSIYNEVDRIIVIEGAVKNRPNSTDDGHSVDNTVEIIEDFKRVNDPENKIVFVKIKRHWKNLEEMKQTFIDLCFPGDWIIINDADEFYLPEDIRRLRKLIDLKPHATEVVPNFLHFYGDFNHVAVPGPEWQPQHQRIFKVTRGMKYNAHPVVTDVGGSCTYFSPHYQHRRYMMNNFFIYHYGYARSNMSKIMLEKQKYYEKELVAHNNANKKFDQKINDWFNKTEPVLKYNGTHPEQLKLHPMSNNKEEGLNVVGNWEQDSFYKKVINNEQYGNIWLCMTRQSQPYMTFYHNGINILP